MRSRLATGALLSVIAGGCSAYRPKPAVPAGLYTKQVLPDVSDKDLLAKYNAMPDSNDAEKAKKVARRNQILTELIMLIDQNYSDFENHFYGSQATLSTAGDALSLGLTAATAVTGTAEIKSILGAVATGTTGLRTSVEKNFFDQQSRSAVVAKMRSLRATQLATLQDESHMKAGLTAYSLETGLSDVGAYYDAGTVVAALQSIAQTAGQEQTDAANKQLTNGTKTQQIQ
jgi:hypothetical protein